MYVFDTNREMIWSILACFLLAVKRIKPFFTADHTQYALRATLLRKSYLVLISTMDETTNEVPRMKFHRE